MSNLCCAITLFIPASNRHDAEFRGGTGGSKNRARQAGLCYDRDTVGNEGVHDKGLRTRAWLNLLTTYLLTEISTAFIYLLLPLHLSSLFFFFLSLSAASSLHRPSCCRQRNKAFDCLAVVSDHELHIQLFLHQSPLRCFVLSLPTTLS